MIEPHLSRIAVRYESLSAARSRIADVDIAAEMSRAIRSQILSWSSERLLEMGRHIQERTMALLGTMRRAEPAA